MISEVFTIKQNYLKKGGSFEDGHGFRQKSSCSSEGSVKQIFVKLHNYALGAVKQNLCDIHYEIDIMQIWLYCLDSRCTCLLT